MGKINLFIYLLWWNRNYQKWREENQRLASDIKQPQGHLPASLFSTGVNEHTSPGSVTLAVLKHAATTGSGNHDELNDQEGENVAVQEAIDLAEDVHQTRQEYHKIISLLQILKTRWSL